MSSRALKKLQVESDHEHISDSESESETRKKQLNINRFDLLNQQSQSESDVKEDDNKTEDSSATNHNVANYNISKKKKKLKKKSTKYSGNQISSEDNENIDRYLVKSAKTPKPTAPVESANESDSSLICIGIKNLNPHYEMRRIFGKNVVKLENKRTRGQKLSFKPTYIVNVNAAWPPIMKDTISMKICDPPENANQSKNLIWFCFQHSKYYQNIQNMFLQAVEQTDSNFLLKVLKLCPYHVDALIQLSDLCKLTDHFSMAGELIERALFILETAFHPKFNLITKNCRLDYRRQENRGFFVALFKHAQYLESKACCRTAFEVSKIILSFDPDNDPLAIILVIDYYALRSKEYSWFVRFYNEWGKNKNFSQLPNMAYSYALALFFLNKDSEEANKALKYALLMFPGVLKPLIEELSVQADKRVLSHSYFNSGVSGSQSPALYQLVCLYVCRAKLLWKDASVLPWLEKIVSEVLDMVDNEDEIITEYSSKRSIRYMTPPRAVLRHVILSDFKEKVPLAQFVMKEKDPIVMYDPLPPLDSINFYEKKSIPSNSNVSNQPLSIFFQSMLPSFRAQRSLSNQEEINEENEENDGASAAAPGMQSYRELHNSFTSVIDALRNFLTNIRIDRSNEDDDSSDEYSSSSS